MTTQGAFTGWLKDGRKHWRAVCAGPTESDCYAALLRVPAEGQFVQRLVLASGKRPAGAKGGEPTQRGLF